MKSVMREQNSLESSLFDVPLTDKSVLENVLTTFMSLLGLNQKLNITLSLLTRLKTESEKVK
jgi:hypothetical protein